MKIVLISLKMVCLLTKASFQAGRKGYDGLSPMVFILYWALLNRSELFRLSCMWSKLWHDMLGYFEDMTDRILRAAQRFES